MSYRDQKYSHFLSPRGSGAYLQGYSSKKSQPLSNQTVSEDERGTPVTKKHLEIYFS